MEVIEGLYLCEVVELDGYRVETWIDNAGDMLALYIETEEF